MIFEQDKTIEKQQKQIENLSSSQQKSGNGEEKSLGEMMNGYKDKEDINPQQSQVFEPETTEKVEETVNEDIKIQEETPEPTPQPQPEVKNEEPEPAREEPEQSNSPQSKFKKGEIDLANIFNVNN